MRLGQLAREYSIPIQDIILYLKEAELANEALHVNTKLDEETKILVTKRFGKLLDKPSENIDLPTEAEHVVIDEIVEDLELSNIEEPIEIDAPIQETEIEIHEEPVVDEVQEAEDVIAKQEVQEIREVEEEQETIEESIETDRLLELLESEESPIDLSKITLIKAPKKELSGLKVVGKIELTEPKVKKSQKEQQHEKAANNDRGNNHKRAQYSNEDLEKKRLRVKKNREEYEIRQEKRKEEKEKNEKKAKKKAHYEQKIQRTIAKKQKNRKQPTLPEVKEIYPKNQSLLGRFWRWLNT